ncbi:MAG TPA: hypothetical protein VGU45_11935 [Microvirga sp.]|nr:hypothetical protein [Microvirga sp.]
MIREPAGHGGGFGTITKQHAKFMQKPSKAEVVSYFLALTAAGIVNLLADWSAIQHTLCTAPVVTNAIPSQAFSCLEFWLNRYQDLTGGMLALVGALATVWMIQRQIGQVENLDSRRRGDESYASRSVLPLALSTVCDYAERCAQALAAINPEDRTSVRGFQPPDLPANLVEPLRECIRYSDREQAKELADLLSAMQVQHTRLRGIPASAFRNAIITGHTIDSRMIDTADLYARASNLFDYARRSEEGKMVSVSFADLRSSLWLMGIHEGENESLYKLLDARENRRNG